MTPIGQHMTINGNEIYYEYYKHSQSDETIVCLHGFLSSSFSFRKLTPLLIKRYNVVCIDWPPFGKSGREKRFVYSIHNLAVTIIQLIEKLTISNITIIGHSMGGQVALNIVHLRPDLVKKIILLASSGYLKKFNRSLVFSSYIPLFHLFVKKHLEKSGLEKNLQNVVYNHSIIDQEMENGYLEPFLQADIFHALTRMIRNWEGDLPEAILRKIETPILLIWGKYDKVVPLHIGQRLHQDLKNSQLIILENTGHLVPEEKPEEVMQLISEFIEKA